LVSHLPAQRPTRADGEAGARVTAWGHGRRKIRADLRPARHL